MKGGRWYAFAGLIWLVAAPARGFDVILDPRQASQLLAEIAKFHDASRNAATKEERLEALYEMGERVLDLTDLMTQDLEGHGANDPSLVGLIERRLKENGVSISKLAGGWHYDLAAFREYLRLAPSGERAMDARYVLVGFDEPGDDVAALQKSIAAKEQFIRDHPKFQDVSVVELLLAQQHNHLARVYSMQKQQVLSDQQRKLARGRYERIVKLYPKTQEAETAKDALATP
jgi:tetratricopeptide (TPR) repeat protein